MARTINLSASLSISGSGASFSGGKTPSAITQAGNISIAEIQTIEFSAGEAISVGDASGECLIYFENLDATNFVMINTADSWSAPVIKLKAGECAVLPSTGTTWYAKADSGAVDLLAIIAER